MSLLRKFYKRIETGVTTVEDARLLREILDAEWHEARKMLPPFGLPVLAAAPEDYRGLSRYFMAEFRPSGGWFFVARYKRDCTALRQCICPVNITHWRYFQPPKGFPGRADDD